jgi:mitogen-activated protein kinase kinase kinase
MLTVDEITAEVERRRASVITFAESEDGEMDDEAEEDEATYARRISAGLTPGLVPQGEDEDDNVFEEDESDEDESSEEEEEEEEEEPSDEEGKKYTSTGCECCAWRDWQLVCLLGNDFVALQPNAPSSGSRVRCSAPAHSARCSSVWTLRAACSWLSSKSSLGKVAVTARRGGRG